MAISAVSGASTPSLTGVTDPAQARILADLRARDRQVRAHEAAHLAAAGGLARGGASFTYTRGPDGRNYATGGEVSIDATAADTPSATLAKAQQIQAAALAPADPSPQDRSVAAAAATMAARARRDLQTSGPGQLLDTTA
ncbi:MAG TPA: putative metalloprotease CJM1_0395 family protein [Geothrix sp.]|nr:putative metalloprotease CJM1_0395 family protein [Geothrix sp.]